MLNIFWFCLPIVRLKVSIRGGRVVIKTKPRISHQYIMGMGGIDSTDQMLYVYLYERPTMKHAKKVIFNVLGRKTLNSYILYKINTTEG